MKDIILRARAILILTCLFSPLSVYGTQLEAYTGNASATFTLMDTKDQTRSLSDYRGKVVLVNFWASWCPPCIYEMPKLQKLKKHFANRAFEILTINVAEKKYHVRKFSKVIKLDLPVFLDTASNTFNNWGVKTLPTSFLIDSDGRVRYQIRGDPGWENKETISIIEEMIQQHTNN
ncbi:MAG: TlpA disulfide reductase family protein [Gammaproteobacteria bacterium]